MDDAMYSEMRLAMRAAAVTTLGSGYVNDYYDSAASDFMSVAEWYVDRATDEQRTTIANLQAEVERLTAALKEDDSHGVL